MSPATEVHREFSPVALPPAEPAHAYPLSSWSDVRVGHVSVSPVGAVGPPGWYRISAAVQLGEMTPADVVVSVMPAARDPADAAPLEENDRLWSVLSYGNGSYRFETDIPGDRLRSADRLKIHVGPWGGGVTSSMGEAPRGCWHLVPIEPPDLDS